MRSKSKKSSTKTPVKLFKSKSKKSSTKTPVIEEEQKEFRNILEDQEEVKRSAFHFIKLCNKYIMVDNLDNVLRTTHLQNGNCNIYLVGENHIKKGINNCTGIFDMFYKLQNAIKKIEKSTYKIHLMIEIEEEHSKKDYNYFDNNLQINNVRRKYVECIRNPTSCDPLVVHWTDPIISIYNKNPYIDSNTGNDTPLWLKLLNTYQRNMNYFYLWKTNNEISKKHFDINKEDDIFGILIDNPLAMKEINDAKIINTFFKESNIKKIFFERYELIKLSENYTEDQKLYSLFRTVMDLYTVAKIINSQSKRKEDIMNNVIIYAGNNHTDFISYLLNKYLNFNLINQITGKCYNKELDAYGFYIRNNNKIIKREIKKMKAV